MDTSAIFWDSRSVFINDDYLTELINDDVETIILITPKGRYSLTTDDALDYSEWANDDTFTRVIPFSLIGR